MSMPGPRGSRSRRLGALLFVVGGSLYVVAFQLLIVVGERFLVRVGRTPALVSTAMAYALIVLALGAHALRVRPAPPAVPTSRSAASSRRCPGCARSSPRQFPPSSENPSRRSRNA